MTRKIRLADVPEFDAAEYFDSEQAAAGYLTAIPKEENPPLWVAAPGDIARDSGLTREALYKALRPDTQPRFDTINRVCAALGVRLVAQPIHS
jgi:probable addiction module antidote protein